MIERFFNTVEANPHIYETFICPVCGRYYKHKSLDGYWCPYCGNGTLKDKNAVDSDGEVRTDQTATRLIVRNNTITIGKITLTKDELLILLKLLN